MLNDIERLEAKLKQYREISEEMKVLEAKKKALSQEVLAVMPEGMKQLKTPGFKVIKQQRLSFKTTVEEAGKFSAVKTDIVIDKAKLKALYESGQEVPGVSCSEFVLIKENQ